MWEDKGWETLLDYLRYHNEMDVRRVLPINGPGPMALWPYGPMVLLSCVFCYEHLECEFDSIFVVYSTRIRVNIVSKNARIHAQSSRSASENFQKMTQGTPLKSSNLKGLDETFETHLLVSDCW